MFRKFVSFLLLLLSLTTLPALAQEEPPEEPDGPAATVPPEIRAQNEANAQAAYDEFLNRSIYYFSVAYLVKDNSQDKTNLISSENIHTMMGALNIDSWDEFVQLNNKQPFQIILIHESMLEEIDMDWTQQAYRNGVIIVGINIDLQGMASLAGDACVTQKYELDFVDQDFFVYFTYVVQAEKEEDRNAIHTAELETCKDATTVIGQTEVQHGVTASFLESPFDLQDLINTLVLDTMNYGISEFVNNEIIPLPQN